MDKNANFVFTMEVRDDNGLLIDLSTYDASATGKKHYESNVSFDFVTNAYANGTLMLTCDPTVTSNLDPGDWVYDVKLVDSSNNVSYVVEGRIRIKDRAT